MALIEEAHKASRLLLDHAYVRLVARAEPDAVCATALLAHALRRENVDFHVTWVDRLGPEACARLADERNDALVLVGLSGDAHTDDVVAGRKVVLDRGNSTLDAEAVLDPGHSVDHATRASLASLAQLLAVAMSKRNRDLAPLAVAGAIANAHHVGGGLRGLDGEILAEALEQDLLLRESGLALHGSTLIAALSQLDAPYVSGVTGRARHVKKIVLDLGLSGDAPPGSVKGADAEKLGSLLTLRLLAQDAPDAALDALFRPRLRGLQGPHTGLDVGELARNVEAACIQGRCGLAFGALWPDATVTGEVQSTAAQARETLVAALLRAERDARRDGPITIADAPHERACAALADRVAMSLAAEGRLAIARHTDASGATFALRAFGDKAPDALAAARHAVEIAGGHATGTRTQARLGTSEPERALKAIEEALA